MEIKYTADAFFSLASLVNFIESKNTEGAGIRWLNRYENFLKSELIFPEKRKICNNKTLKRLGLLCLSYKEWTIAFSVHENYVLIEAILHKTRISD
jgi:hypothetical protein